jgi:ethanolamine utilization protein EutN
MEEATVIGTVIATQAVGSLRGRKLVWITPVDETGAALSDPIVALDVTQSGRGSRVFFVRGREAAQALEDPFCPVDAAVLGIVDHSRMLPMNQDPAAGMRPRGETDESDV